MKIPIDLNITLKELNGLIRKLGLKRTKSHNLLMEIYIKTRKDNLTKARFITKADHSQKDLEVQTLILIIDLRIFHQESLELGKMAQLQAT